MITTKLRAKHGMRKLRDLRRANKPASVVVGVLAGSAVHPNAKHGQTVAEIAFWNELGTNRIPPRPFLSTTIRKNDYYKPQIIAALKSYLKGHKFSKGELSLIGLRAANDVKATITALRFPPNALSTQRRKADKKHVKATEVDNPLIDSGTLRASIAHEVR